jgi:hypothetical protein
MPDWKEEVIAEYISYQKGLTYVKRERSEDPILKELQEEKEILRRKTNEAYKPYEVEIAGYLQHIEELQQKLLTCWDTSDKTFKCKVGSATIRTTRSLKVDDKETLISTLQRIGKLTQCITGWDLAYLRKLADAGMFDVDWGEPTSVHYDEKMSVVIRGVKNEEKK